VNLTLQPPLDAPGYRAAIERLLAAYPEEAHRGNLNLLGPRYRPGPEHGGEDADSVVLAAALIFCFPGAPCIFYGTRSASPGTTTRVPGWPSLGPPRLVERAVTRGVPGLAGPAPSASRGAAGTYRHLYAAGPVYVCGRDLEGEHLLVATNSGISRRRCTCRWRERGRSGCGGAGKPG